MTAATPTIRISFVCAAATLEEQRCALQELNQWRRLRRLSMADAAGRDVVERFFPGCCDSDTDEEDETQGDKSDNEDDLVIDERGTAAETGHQREAHEDYGLRLSSRRNALQNVMQHTRGTPLPATHHASCPRHHGLLLPPRLHYGGSPRRHRRVAWRRR